MPRKITRILSSFLSLLLLLQQTSFAEMAVQLNLASHLASLHQAISIDKFRPLHLRYLEYLPQDNSFKLLIDKGNIVGAPLVGAPESINNRAGTRPAPTVELERVSKTLFKYFLIGLSLPNESFWVNLRPDSPDNIIDPYLEKTDIGRIMLETDLELKKDTAKATSPDTKEGKEYWERLYRKADELFGSQNITIPTLTRPWIVPDEIIVRENNSSAYVYKASLKVMLEEDYFKRPQTADRRPQTKDQNTTGLQSPVYSLQSYSFTDPRLKQLNEYSTELIKELIIPKLTLAVNTSKKYSELRQVYYSLILAQWFKARYASQNPVGNGLKPFPTDIINLINSKDLTNLISKVSWSKDTYFKDYQKSFKDGEYNFQEPVYTVSGKSIRSYFSGGMMLADSTATGIAPAGRNHFSVGSHLQAIWLNKDNFNNIEILRGAMAEVLEKNPSEITDEQVKGLQKAHFTIEPDKAYEFGENSLPQPHSVATQQYTLPGLHRKAEGLRDLGFDQGQRRKLMKAGLVGNTASNLRWNLYYWQLQKIASLLEPRQQEYGILYNIDKALFLNRGSKLIEDLSKDKELVAQAAPLLIRIIKNIQRRMGRSYITLHDQAIKVLSEAGLPDPDVIQFFIEESQPRYGLGGPRLELRYADQASIKRSEYAADSLVRIGLPAKDALMEEAIKIGDRAGLERSNMAINIIKRLPLSSDELNAIISKIYLDRLEMLRHVIKELNGERRGYYGEIPIDEIDDLCAMHTGGTMNLFRKFIEEAGEEYAVKAAPCLLELAEMFKGDRRNGAYGSTPSRYNFAYFITLILLKYYKYMPADLQKRIKLVERIINVTSGGLYLSLEEDLRKSGYDRTKLLLEAGILTVAGAESIERDNLLSRLDKISILLELLVERFKYDEWIPEGIVIKTVKIIQRLGEDRKTDINKAIVEKLIHLIAVVDLKRDKRPDVRKREPQILTLLYTLTKRCNDREALVKVQQALLNRGWKKKEIGEVKLADGLSQGVNNPLNRAIARLNLFSLLSLDDLALFQGNSFSEDSLWASGPGCLTRVDERQSPEYGSTSHHFTVSISGGGRYFEQTDNLMSFEELPVLNLGEEFRGVIFYPLYVKRGYVKIEKVAEADLVKLIETFSRQGTNLSKEFILPRNMAHQGMPLPERAPLRTLLALLNIENPLEIASLISIDVAEGNRTGAKMEVKPEYSQSVRIVSPAGVHVKTAIDIAAIYNKFYQQNRSLEAYITYNGQIVNVADRARLSALNIHQGDEVVISATGGQHSRELVESISGLLKNPTDDTVPLVYSLDNAPLDREVIGGKGLNLVRMRRIGIPVPNAVILRADRNFEEDFLTTETATAELAKEFQSASAADNESFSYLGFARNLSVRSSPRDSCPGLLDTVLEVKVAGQSIKKDRYYLFIFNIIKEAVQRVKASVHNPGVKEFLKLQGLPEELPVAVIIQQMVYGDAFVLSTVDQASGKEGVYIEYAKGRPAKDIVSGKINPKPLEDSGIDEQQLNGIRGIVGKLQAEFGKHIQVEGVIENSEIYILQCRTIDPPKGHLKDEGVVTRDAVGQANQVISRGNLTNVQGVMVRPQEASELSSDIDKAHILFFEHADKEATEILLQALDRKLKVVGIVTKFGGKQTHFASVVNQLNNLGYNILYMSGVDVQDSELGGAYALDVARGLSAVLVSKTQVSGDSSSAASSPAMIPAAKASAEGMGGIDLRFMPIITQAMSNLSSGFKLTNDIKLKLSNVDLDDEWAQIEKMAEAGITPSAERLKEYIQASCVKGNASDKTIDKIILCISKILRCDEDNCSKSDPVLMDILIVLESQRTPQELNRVFLGAVS
ncbi:MAG: HPr family phosphocarrier protein [Candidatus Omnitrophota bacterium]